MKVRDWYFVCERCNCKFFHREKTAACPRCGSSLASNEQLTPPWKSSQNRRCNVLKISEVAQRLNCSIANVYALRDAGRLVFVSTGANGKGFRVEESELERFIRESREHRGKDVPEFPTKTKPTAGSPFKHLDADRLQEAWRRQGDRSSPGRANTSPKRE